MRKYYYASGVRVATPALVPERSTGASVRTGGQTCYLLGDHPSAGSEPALSLVEGTSLGGTNITTNSSGVQISKLL